jgi:hypothetical protein
VSESVVLDVDEMGIAEVYSSVVQQVCSRDSRKLKLVENTLVESWMNLRSYFLPQIHGCFLKYSLPR